VKDGNLVAQPPFWDMNQDSYAVEIVDDNRIPIYQVQYSSKLEFTITGIFKTDENAAMVCTPTYITGMNSPFTPEKIASVGLRPIFLYPSSSHPGQRLDPNPVDPATRRTSPKMTPWRLHAGPGSQEINAAAASMIKYSGQKVRIYSPFHDDAADDLASSVWAVLSRSQWNLGLFDSDPWSHADYPLDFGSVMVGVSASDIKNASALSLFQMRAKSRRFTLKPLRDNALTRIFHQIF
jgi:hypothetical protein